MVISDSILRLVECKKKKQQRIEFMKNLFFRPASDATDQSFEHVGELITYYVDVIMYADIDNKLLQYTVHDLT